MDWSHVQMYQQWINREKYEVHRYFVPDKLEGRIKFLRKFFRVMDRESVPQQYKRRKNSIEYAESALMILGRINSLFVSDIPIIAGSGYLSPNPWAVFGEIPEVDSLHSRVIFRDFDDIANHYKPLIINGESSGYNFSFRLCPVLAWDLSNRYFFTVHYIVCIALCLLYDILLNCGPDCVEFSDLFTNDIRVSFPDIDAWQELRCKVMGRHGRIRDKKWPVRLGQYYEPIVSLESAIDFDEIPLSGDIAKGEKVKIFKLVESKNETCFGGRCDEGIQAPETDVAFNNRIKKQLDKYQHLGIGPTWYQ